MGGISAAVNGPATIPASGHMWYLAAKKGLTYRSYREYAARVVGLKDGRICFDGTADELTGPVVEAIYHNEF